MSPIPMSQADGGARTLRNGWVAPFYDLRQTFLMTLALPFFYVVNRSLWLVIGVCADWRLATGSARW